MPFDATISLISNPIANEEPYTQILTHPLLLGLRLLEDLLDNLLLLNQESTNDTVANAVGTS